MTGKVTSILFFVLAAVGVVAQQFEISRHTIDSGGVMRGTGDGFELSGTIGQPEASVLAGDGFELSGGFWFELVPGDCDESGAMDLLDHEPMTQCMDGPVGGVSNGCDCFDVDRSGHVDLRDFAETLLRTVAP